MQIGCMMHNFKSMPLEEVCGTIAELGYDTVEACALKGGYPYVDLDLPPEPQMRIIESAGLKCPGISVHCEMIADPEAVAYLKKAARWAADAGISTIISGEGWKPDAMPMEEAFERGKASVLEVVQECAKVGVHFAMEPHGTFSLTPDGLKRLMDVSASPYYFINYDVGNLSGACNVCNAELLPRFIARVGWVHIKDFVREGDGKSRAKVDIGSGDVDIEDSISILKSSGYAGVVSAEILGHGDPVGSSRRALAYLERLVRP